MKRAIHIFGILFCLLAGYHLSAQQIEWSNLERFRSKTAYNRVIGANESGYYVLRSRNYEIRSKAIIERYRENLGMDFSKKLPGMRGSFLINAFVNPKGVLVWKSRYDLDGAKLQLYAQQLNEDAEITGREILIAQATPKGYSDDGDFVVVENIRKTHFVVIYTEPAPKGKSYLNVRVYTYSLEQVSSHQELMDFEDRNFDLEQVAVDTLGNTFILVSGVNEKFEKRTPERIGIHLYSLGANLSWQHFYLNFEDTYISSPIMAIDEVNDKLVVSGLYSLQGLTLSKGTLDFALRISDGKLLYHNFVPFSTDFVTEIAGEKAAREESELRDFVIKYMVPRTDGGYVLFGEEFSVSQQSYTYYVNGIAQVSSRNVYNYGKIFLIMIGKQGQLEGTRVIGKGQSSVNDYGYYSSFTLFKRKERIHILFNDKLKGNGGVIHTVLDTNGNLEDENLFGNQGAFISIVPSEAKQLDINTILIPTSKDRKFAFVKISY